MDSVASASCAQRVYETGSRQQKVGSFKQRGLVLVALAFVLFMKIKKTAMHVRLNRRRSRACRQSKDTIESVSVRPASGSVIRDTGSAMNIATTSVDKARERL